VGELSPEGKRQLIARIDRGDTLMLGDGINDGLALSTAFCSGTPAIDRPFVPSRADFYYLSAGLSPIRSALRASHAVRKVVRHALFDRSVAERTAASHIAVGLELALIFSGAWLLWRLVLSPSARAEAPSPRLVAWEISISDFLLFLWCVVMGGFLFQLGAVQLVKSAHLDQTERLIFAGGGFHNY
jgi:hypothetical protein